LVGSLAAGLAGSAGLAGAGVGAGGWPQAASSAAPARPTPRGRSHRRVITLRTLPPLGARPAASRAPSLRAEPQRGIRLAARRGDAAPRPPRQARQGGGRERGGSGDTPGSTGVGCKGGGGGGRRAARPARRVGGGARAERGGGGAARLTRAPPPPATKAPGR